MNFLDSVSKNTQISNFMKIRPAGAELFHVDRRTDRHDVANVSFRNFAKPPNKTIASVHAVYGVLDR